MKSEEKNALIAAMFQGANIKVEQFIAVNEGTVVYNDYKGGKAESVIITKGIRNETDDGFLKEFYLNSLDSFSINNKGKADCEQLCLEFE